MKRSLFMMLVFTIALIASVGTKADVIEKSSASCSVISKHVDHASFDMIVPRIYVLAKVEKLHHPVYNVELREGIRYVNIMNKGSPACALTNFSNT